MFDKELFDRYNMLLGVRNSILGECMRKKEKRTLDVVGKKNYEFDYIKEKNAYMYLCCLRMKKKDRKNLSENMKFDTYKEWVEYIKSKCTTYSDDKLKEFSRYLNQRLRNTKPEHEYWSLLGPIFLTLLFTQLPDIIRGIVDADLSSLPLLGKIIYLLFAGVLISPVIYCMWSMVKPIWDNNTDEHFFEDYKAIIDRMIEESG